MILVPKKYVFYLKIVFIFKGRKMLTKNLILDLGVDIMMSSYGVLPGYIKQQVIKLTSTRHRNTITISA